MDDLNKEELFENDELDLDKLTEGLEDEFDELLDDTDESEDSEEIKGFFDSAVDKVKEIYREIDARAYETYTEPYENSVVDKKNSLITIGSCAVGIVLLVVGLYFFLTGFKFYTTGVKADDFIENFNSITAASDSDIYSIVPSYTDILIPEGSRLGGNRTIDLLDGGVKISAKTRFGRIVNLSVDGSTLPCADLETGEFTSDEGNIFAYFYVCLGKAYTAMCEPDGVADVADAVKIGSAIYSYAYMYNHYYGDEELSVDVNTDVGATYYFKEFSLRIAPKIETLTTAEWPEWLKKADEPVIEPTEETSSSDVSTTDAA